MISLQAFLAGVAAIVAAGPVYQLGGFGLRGICDCIGLIIGAIRRAGGTWKGIHGSNWAARNEMVSLLRDPVLELGALLYKAREPTDRGYKLPERYRGHRDQRDYYHVGVVTSLNPLRITHCTTWSGGSGIKVDTALGAWRWGGRAKGIDYESEARPMMTKAVIASSGSTVRMRVTPDERATITAKVPVGSRVQVLQVQGDWDQISYGGKTGWMMASFLQAGEATSPEEAAQPPALPLQIVYLTVPLDVAKALKQALEEVL